MIYLNKEDVLLFQGDSITHGGRVESSWDQNHLIGHGYPDYIAQTLGLENIERNPTIINRGISGDTLVKIDARKQADIFDIKPTIMSLLVGTNDASAYVIHKAGQSPEQFGDLLRKILTETKEKFPNIKFILCQPFRYYYKANCDEKNLVISDTNERGEIIKQIAREFSAPFVPFKDAIDKYAKSCPIEKLVWDGVHPTYVGHAILAKEWLTVVENAFA